MPTWPASLPPLPIELPEEYEPTAIITRMAQGPRKRRNLYTGASLLLEVPADRYILTLAQRTTLTAFWVTDTNRGIDPFDWTDPLPGLGAMSVCFLDARRPLFTARTGGVSDRLYRCSVAFEVLP